MNTGTLRLTVSRRGNRSIMKESFHAGALKLSRPLYIEHTPMYYLLHTGGGYVGGDIYEQTICVEAAASLLLTTQSATKIYKATTPSKQLTTIRLHGQSDLTLLQDPIIAYEGARFEQRTNVHMTSSSTLHYSEIFTAGWAEDGRLFTYDELYTHFDITMDGKKIYIDRVKWGNNNQRTMLQYGTFTHYGSYICIQQLDGQFFEALQQLIAQYTEANIGYSKIGIYGFTLKILANSTQLIEAVILKAYNLTRIAKNLKPLQIRKY